VTLEDDIRKLADLRDEYAKIDGELEVSRKNWLEANAELILKRSVLSDKIDSLEKAILDG
jgi:hypothetical protein